MAMNKKIDSLSQEVFRRLHNTKFEVEWEDTVVILTKFMSELMASGYNENDRYQILKSGIKLYENLREKERAGLRPFYRKKNFERSKRMREKEAKKETWFQNKDNKFASVFFVPPTPNSVLLKRLKDTEEKYQIDKNSRIKFVEVSGRKYVDFFKQNDPFSKKCEPEEECLICSNEENRISCKTSNIGYSISCNICKERGKEVSYEGESSRSGFIRMKEHVKDLEKKRKEKCSL